MYNFLWMRTLHKSEFPNRNLCKEKTQPRRIIPNHRHLKCSLKLTYDFVRTEKNMKLQEQTRFKNIILHVDTAVDILPHSSQGSSKYFNYPELLPALLVLPRLSFGFARVENQARKEKLLHLVTSVEVSWIYKKTWETQGLPFEEGMSRLHHALTHLWTKEVLPWSDSSFYLTEL